MLIHCPTCTTSYEVNPSSLGAAGRSVRCVRCRTVWFAATRPAEPAAAIGRRMAAGPVSQNAAPISAPPSSSATNGDVSPVAGEEDVDAVAAIVTAGAASNDQAGTAIDNRPMLDPGARALAMDTTSGDPIDLYEPITMADAPPLAPMDHDASKIPAEVPMLIGVANRVDAFVARRAPRASAAPARSIAMPGAQSLTVMLAVILVGLLAWRTEVVAAMPQMASLYAIIGLPVNVRGLVFEDVKTVQEMHEGVQVLAVDGAIANATRGTLEMPRLRFALLNSSGAEIYTWTALPSRSVLAGGDKLAFRSRLASPPPDGREITVRFYTRRDAAGGLH
jgi:predicted Zn finger-like uncharacterized protein